MHAADPLPTPALLYACPTFAMNCSYCQALYCPCTAPNCTAVTAPPGQAFEALCVNEFDGARFEPDANGRGMTDGQQVVRGS